MKIQTVISGFSGKPTTLYSILQKSDVLDIQKESTYREDRFGDCLIISNVELPDRELLFDDEKFSDSVTRFFELKGAGMLEFGKGASRANPEHAIENDGVRDSGARIFRMKPEITNAQVAALATCWYVKQNKTINKVLDFQERLLAIQNGGILSI